MDRLTNRQFSLQMAVERVKSIQAFRPEQIIDIAEQFMHYLSKDAESDTPHKEAPKKPRRSASGKNSK